MTYAAFLRAINVGTHNRIRMVDLRALVEELGYGGVRTHLQTGNVALDAGRQRPATVAARLEQALTASGLKSVDAMVRTRAELEALVRARPFARYDEQAYYRFVLFTRTPVEPPTTPREVKGATFLPSSPDILLAVCAKGSRPANANAVAESYWKVRATGRWWNVVEDFTRDVVAA
jgi:uncharacterized protein (DUF1697 family)